MAYKDHIAITSGDKSMTRRSVSVAGCPRCPFDRVTEGDSSDTYRRIVRDSEIATCDLPPGSALAALYLQVHVGRPPPSRATMLIQLVMYHGRIVT